MQRERQRNRVDAFALFPALLGNGKRTESPKGAEAARPSCTDEPLPQSAGATTKPPPPPDLAWLRQHESIERAGPSDPDLTFALVLAHDSKTRSTLSGVLERIGYHVETATSAVDAVDRLRTVNYAIVALHSGFEGRTSLDQSSIHAFLNQLPMSARRLIYYILIGPGFHTLYDLEALAHSANLVINDGNVAQFDTIVRKGLQDYENLFAPLLQALELKRSN